MKISRPTAATTAAAAAVIIAAAAVPSFHTDGAGASQDQALSTKQAAIIAANSETATTLPAEAAPTTTAAATLSAAPAPTATPATSAAPSSPVVKGSAAPAAASQSNSPDPQIGGSLPDGDAAGLKRAVNDLLGPDAEGAEAQNMPAVDTYLAGDARTPENVSALTTPLKTYKGGQQAWQHNIGLIKGGQALKVHSDAMGRDIPVAVILATDAAGNYVDNAPTYYLLNGAGGSEQDTDWLTQAFYTVRDTFANEPVNVVIPMEGAFSYYVDWLTEPQENAYLHGKQMWSTFLGSELPNSIEPYMNANGKRAVSGFSMSATSSLLLAEHNPGKYAAVGSFSGCAATSTPLPSFFVGLTVNRGSAGRGDVTPANLWGPRGSEYNRYNDALVMAENLRNTDTKVYLSAGTGLPSDTDMIGYLREANNVGSTDALAQAMTLHVEGGAIEGAMNACTHDLYTKLNALNVPVTFNRRATGTHSWPNWQEDLKVSWDNVIKPALLTQ